MDTLNGYPWIPLDAVGSFKIHTYILIFCMDVLLLGVIGATCIGLALIFRDVLIRNAEIRAEERLAKTGYYRAIGRMGLEKRWGEQKNDEEEEPAEPGEWVTQLFELANIPIDALYQDELPAELQAILPAVKGFVDSMGGIQPTLEKLKAGAGGISSDQYV